MSQEVITQEELDQLTQELGAKTAVACVRKGYSYALKQHCQELTEQLNEKELRIQQLKNEIDDLKAQAEAIGIEV